MLNTTYCQASFTDAVWFCAEKNNLKSLKAIMYLQTNVKEGRQYRKRKYAVHIFLQVQYSTMPE